MVCSHCTQVGKFWSSFFKSLRVWAEPIKTAFSFCQAFSFAPLVPKEKAGLWIFCFYRYFVRSNGVLQKIQSVILSEVEVCVVKRSKPRSNATKGSRLDFLFIKRSRFAPSLKSGSTPKISHREIFSAQDDTKQPSIAQCNTAKASRWKFFWCRIVKNCYF